jgi:hypothetical protein
MNEISDSFCFVEDENPVIWQGGTVYTRPLFLVCSTNPYAAGRYPNARYTAEFFGTAQEMDAERTYVQHTREAGCTLLPSIAEYGHSKHGGTPYIVYEGVYEPLKEAMARLDNYNISIENCPEKLWCLHRLGSSHGNIQRNTIFIRTDDKDKQSGLNPMGDPVLMFPMYAFPGTDNERLNKKSAFLKDYVDLCEALGVRDRQSPLFSMRDSLFQVYAQTCSWINQRFHQLNIEVMGGGPKRLRQQEESAYDTADAWSPKQPRTSDSRSLSSSYHWLFEIHTRWYQSTAKGNLIGHIVEYFEKYIAPLDTDDQDKLAKLEDLCAMPWPHTWYIPYDESELSHFPYFSGWLILNMGDRQSSDQTNRAYTRITNNVVQQFLSSSRVTSSPNTNDDRVSGMPFSTLSFPATLRPYGLTVLLESCETSKDFSKTGKQEHPLSVVALANQKNQVSMKFDPVYRKRLQEMLNFTASDLSEHYREAETTQERLQRIMLSHCIPYAHQVGIHTDCDTHNWWLDEERRILDTINRALQHLNNDRLEMCVFQLGYQLFIDRFRNETFPKLHTLLLQYPRPDSAPPNTLCHVYSGTTLPNLTTLVVQREDANAFIDYNDQQHMLVDDFMQLLQLVPSDQLETFSAVTLVPEDNEGWEQNYYPYPNGQTKNLRSWNTEYTDLFFSPDTFLWSIDNTRMLLSDGVQWKDFPHLHKAHVCSPLVHQYISEGATLGPLFDTLIVHTTDNISADELLADLIRVASHKALRLQRFEVNTRHGKPQNLLSLWGSTPSDVYNVGVALARRIRPDMAIPAYHIPQQSSSSAPKNDKLVLSFRHFGISGALWETDFGPAMGSSLIEVPSVELTLQAVSFDENEIRRLFSILHSVQHVSLHVLPEYYRRENRRHMYPSPSPPQQKRRDKSVATVMHVLQQYHQLTLRSLNITVGTLGEALSIDWAHVRRRHQLVETWFPRVPVRGVSFPHLQRLSVQSLQKLRIISHHNSLPQLRYLRLPLKDAGRIDPRKALHLLPHLRTIQLDTCSDHDDEINDDDEEDDDETRLFCQFLRGFPPDTSPLRYLTVKDIGNGIAADTIDNMARVSPRPFYRVNQSWFVLFRPVTAKALWSVFSR